MIQAILSRRGGSRGVLVMAAIVAAMLAGTMHGPAPAAPAPAGDGMRLVA